MRKSYSSTNFKKSKNFGLAQYFSIQEKFVKTNDQIINYIKSTKGKITVIKNYYPYFRIKLNKNSLMQILHKINDKFFYIQEYLKLVINSEKRQSICLESKEYFDKYINLLNYRNYFSILLKNPRNKNVQLKISKKSLQMIIKYLGIDFNEEVFNFIEITIYKEITAYHFEDYNNLNEVLYSIYDENFGKINFYIYKQKKILDPISNYSVKRILDMKNKKDDTNSYYFSFSDDKYFSFKIKKSKFFEKKNKNYIEKLAVKSDYKLLCNKYNKNKGFVSKWKKIEKDNIVTRMKKPDPTEFDDFLFVGEKLINELPKIEERKKEFYSKLSNENNYFISIKDINNQNKYINAQYIKLMHIKSTEIDLNNNDNKKYIFDFEIKDFSNKDISVPLNNDQISNCFLNPSLDKYIGILNNNEKYLVKVDFFKNLLNNCKLLDKKNKIEIEYPSKEEKEFSLKEINIDEQDEIKVIEGKINIINEKDTINIIKDEIKYEVKNNEGKETIDGLIIYENNKINNKKDEIKVEENKNEEKENNIEKLLINDNNKINNNKVEIKVEENKNEEKENNIEKLLINDNNNKINNSKDEIKVEENDNIDEIKAEDNNNEEKENNIGKLLINENYKINNNKEEIKERVNNNEEKENNIDKILINKNEIKDEVNNNEKKEKNLNYINNEIKEEIKDEVNNNEGNENNLNNIKVQLIGKIKDEVNIKNINELLTNENDKIKNIKDRIKDEMNNKEGKEKNINDLLIKENDNINNITDEINNNNRKDKNINENDKINIIKEEIKAGLKNNEVNRKNISELLINENDKININEEIKDELNNNEGNEKVNELLISKNNKINNIKDEIKDKFNNDKRNVKNISELFINIKNEQGGQKSRNLKKNKSNSILFGNHFSERKNSELINSETCDSNGSASKINRSSFLLNSFNIMPEKDLYSIQNVVKIKKRDKKKKDNIDKNNKK